MWGSELDDPVLGAKIALAAEEAMKSIKVATPFGEVFFGGDKVPMFLGELGLTRYLGAKGQ